MISSRLPTIRLTAAQSKKAAEKWIHRSDHLPAYGRINRCVFGTENTLNNEYIHHIEEMPFWNESALVSTSRTSSTTYPNASVREERVALSIRRRMLEEQSVDVLAIQECSDRMAALFKEILTSEIDVIVGNGNRNNHVVTFVKRDRFSIESIRILPIFRRNLPHLGGFVWDQWRPAIDVTLSSKRSPCGFPERARFLNFHISSAGQTDEYKADRLKEVRSYVEASSQETPVIFGGDFNAGDILRDEIFGNKYPSIGSHYTQIECIPKDNPQLVALDDIRVYVDPATDRMIERKAIPLSKIDPDANETFQTVIVPLYQQ